MAYQISLEFYGATPELLTTILSRPRTGEYYVCVRGKTSGAVHGAGSFQWTTAVQALATLLVLSARESVAGSHPGRVSLSGESGSLAATLDYAISKQPCWTSDMLGTDSTGNSNIKRFFRRTNSERKYPGPVTISLNTMMLSPAHIAIFWDTKSISTIDTMDHLLMALGHPMNEHKLAANR